MRTLLLFAVACGLTPQAASSASHADPRAFLNRVVAYEARSDTGGLRSPTFLGFLSPRLRKAVRADISHSDVGGLDYDPICQCQDTVALRIVSVVAKGLSAVATLAAGAGTDRVIVHLHLVERDGEWSIADISTKAQPSLIKELESEGVKDR